MSSALYVSMFTQINLSSRDRKRARRKKLAESATKAACYAAVILGAALMKAEPTLSIAATGMLCLVVECFR